MTSIRIALFVGSLRRESFNRRLARAVERRLPESFACDYVRIGELPLYNQDFDDDYPDACRRMKAQVQSAQALLFVTPEYNRSIPGVLKNALDIGSRPHGENVFAGKPGAVLGTSMGATGTALAQQHLRNVLATLDVPLLAQPEMFVQFKEGLIAEDGSVENERTSQFLDRFAERYAAWVRRHLD